MKYQPSEINFITDNLLRSFESREMLYSLYAAKAMSHQNIFKLYFHDNPFIPMLLDLYHYTHQIISKNVVLCHRGETGHPENICFHEKFGWTVEGKVGKGYLGKVSLSPSVSISLGNLSFMSGNCELSGSGTLRIGSYCSFAKNLSIITSNNSHHIEIITTHPLDDSKRGSLLGGDNPEPSTFSSRKSNDVNIGNDVWLGEGVTLTNGVSLGHGCVVGTKALVTRDTKPYGIYGGIPAKLIKYRFSEDIISQLLEIKWWNWNSEQLALNKNLFYTDLSNYKGNLQQIIKK